MVQFLNIRLLQSDQRKEKQSMASSTTRLRNPPETPRPMELTQADKKQIPDPMGYVNEIIGKLEFNTPMLRLDVKATLGAEVDSMLVLEMDVSPSYM